eukprot:1033681-Rhodomonas_salina.1
MGMAEGCIREIETALNTSAQPGTSRLLSSYAYLILFQCVYDTAPTRTREEPQTGPYGRTAGIVLRVPYAMSGTDMHAATSTDMHAATRKKLNDVVGVLAVG